VQGVQLRVSLYANDVILFLLPKGGGIEFDPANTSDSWRCFWAKKNMLKYSGTPIKCQEDMV